MDPRGPLSSDATILPFPHAALKNDEQLLNTILDNMAHGVLLFDSESRLLVCNQRYVSMYGLTQDAAKVGRSLLEPLTAIPRTMSHGSWKTSWKGNLSATQ
jgi:PAS domain-containing protein